jgi:hypothetical protein
MPNYRPRLDDYPTLTNRFSTAGYDVALHYLEAGASRPVITAKHKVSGENKLYYGQTFMVGAPILFVRWLEGIVYELAAG